MHAQAARGFGDVTVTFGEHALDVLPLEPLDRQRPGADLGRGIARVAVQCRDKKEPVISLCA